MSALNINNIQLRLGNSTILHNASLCLANNEVTCLLGESGSGKTSLLRVIAGLEPDHQGTVTLLGKSLSDCSTFIPPEQRGIGIVFQDYALFPHLTVSQNICFGLKKSSKKQRILHHMLQLVGLADHAKKYPHQLSGGQQQRVALARALAPEPKLLLLDEPFSHLDVHLREQLAHDLRTMIKQQGVMALMVTHDQQEAFAVADNIAVMHNGSIEQCADAKTLWHHPATPYVASFIGEGTLLNKNHSDHQALLRSFGITLNNDKNQLLLRPNALRINAQSPNNINVSVNKSSFHGDHYLLKCITENQVELLVTSHTAIHSGEQIQLSLAEQALHQL